MPLTSIFYSFRKLPKGFTLLEIMIVVTIIGLLAALAALTYRHNRIHVQAKTFGSELRVFRDALEQCTFETGTTQLGAAAGQLSDEFAPYVTESQWTSETPIGGQWIVESHVDGLLLTVGAVGINADTEVLELIDRMLDDGNLGSGRLLQKGGNQLTWIVE